MWAAGPLRVFFQPSHMPAHLALSLLPSGAAHRPRARAPPARAIPSVDSAPTRAGLVDYYVLLGVGFV